MDKRNPLFVFAIYMVIYHARLMCQNCETYCALNKFTAPRTGNPFWGQIYLSPELGFVDFLGTERIKSFPALLHETT